MKRGCCSRAQSDRCGKRGDAREGVSHSGSGYQVHGSIPAADPGQWHERHPTTTTITEPECDLRKSDRNSATRMLGLDDPGVGVAITRDSQMLGDALQPRATS